MLIVGAVFAGLRLEGVLSGRIRRDGANATRVLARLASTSKFAPQLQLILLQGIALGGFNVVDIAALHEARTVIRRLAVHSRIPEPLRTAHLIAGVMATGESRGRP